MWHVPNISRWPLQDLTLLEDALTDADNAGIGKAVFLAQQVDGPKIPFPGHRIESGKSRILKEYYKTCKKTLLLHQFQQKRRCCSTC